MTQEEKAKAYDEAIERANSLLSSNELGNAWIYKLLPELKESEDERIRKELLNYLYDVHDDNEERARWIDWLEKQGEQKPVEWSEKYIADIFEKVGLAKIAREQESGALAFALQSAMIELSKAAPKVAEWSEEDELRFEQIDFLIRNSYSVKDYYKTLSDWFKSLKDRVQPQVNVRKLIEKLEWLENTKTTIWSEDDEAMRKTTLQYLENTKGSCAAACVPYIVKCIDWLKSLKDRVQPKVELTQVDKVILEAAIAFVEHNNHFNCWRGVDKHTVLSALHSLRPQNQWKPSDEQIKVCKEVYADLLSAKGFDVGTINSELNRLEEQLKKLSEE